MLVAPTLNAQQTSGKLIYGQAVADSASTEGINIVNLVTRQSTITDSSGKFSIVASVGDLLVLSAVQFEVARYIIEEEDLKKDLIRIKLISKINQLEETVVNQYSGINAEAMGIISAGQKKYTPAERRLAASQSGPVDIILNMFSGKTEMREKEIGIEKKEFLLKKLEYLYDDKFYVERLKIPQSQIQAFKYFAVEDEDFMTAINAKENNRAAFLLGKLADQFLQRSADEK
jgi:hypothetical protein